VSLPVTSVNTRKPMRRASPTAAAPAPSGVKLTVTLYRFCAPGVLAGHHSATALSFAASTTRALELPAGSVTRTGAAEPPGQPPAAVSVPEVAAGASKCTSTFTVKSPCWVSVSGACG
jgi:hypothetical protein